FLPVRNTRCHHSAPLRSRGEEYLPPLRQPPSHLLPAPARAQLPAANIFPSSSAAAASTPPAPASAGFAPLPPRPPMPPASSATSSAPHSFAAPHLARSSPLLGSIRWSAPLPASRLCAP